MQAGAKPASPAIRASRSRYQRAGVSALGPTRTAGLLIGATIGLAVAAMSDRFQAVFDVPQVTITPHAPVAAGVAGAALIALSLGVRLPQRIAIWICANAWRRRCRGLQTRARSPGRPGPAVHGRFFTPTGSPVSRGDVIAYGDLPLDDVRADRGLYWTVLSVISLCTGALVALVPLGTEAASAAYGWFLERFLWPPGPLAVLQAVIIFSVAFVPVGPLGLAASCAHHLSCRFGLWETVAGAWLLFGAAIGVASCGALHAATQRSDLILYAAALPSLVLSLVAALAFSHDKTSTGAAGPRQEMAPVAVLPRPRLIRVGSVAAGCSATSLAALCTTVSAGETMSNVWILGGSLAMTGIGAWLGSRPDGISRVSGRANLSMPAGLSRAWFVAGGITVLTAVGSFTGPAGGVCVLGMAGSAAAGFAMVRGLRIFVEHAASRSASGAMITARSLMYAGLVVWIFAPTLSRIAAPPAASLILGLVLLGNASLASIGRGDR